MNPPTSHKNNEYDDGNYNNNNNRTRPPVSTSFVSSSFAVTPTPIPSSPDVTIVTTTAPVEAAARTGSSSAPQRSFPLPPPPPPPAPKISTTATMVSNLPSSSSSAGAAAETGTGTGTVPSSASASASSTPKPPIISSTVSSSQLLQQPPATFIQWKDLPYSYSYSSSSSTSSTRQQQLQQQQYSGSSPLLNNNNNNNNNKRFPILLIGTEQAHCIAYKNNLHLSDLFNGFVYNSSSNTINNKGSSNKSSVNATSGTSNTSTTNSNNNTVPIRSVSKVIYTNIDQMMNTIQFVEEESIRSTGNGSITNSSSSNSSGSSSIDSASPAGAGGATSNTSTTISDLLQQATAIQSKDGNIQQELSILEDTVDHLLAVTDPSDNANNSSSTSTTTTTMMDRFSAMVEMEQNDFTSGMNDSPYGNTTEQQQQQQQQQQYIRDAYKLSSSQLSTIPWLQRYCSALDTCCSTSSTAATTIPFEQFHCPILVLFVATTYESFTSLSDSNDNKNTTSHHHSTTAADAIIAIIRNLQNNYQYYWPKQYYTNGLFDPTSVRQEILILHDPHEYSSRYNYNNNTSSSSNSNTNQSPTEFDEAVLRTQLKVCFGNHVSILRLNSLRISSPEMIQQIQNEETTDMWYQNGTVGHYITVGDRVRINKYLQLYLIPHVIVPAIEKRITELNIIVSDRKKGVKNVFKQLWGGGGSNNSNNNTNQSAAATGSGGFGSINDSTATTSGSNHLSPTSLFYDLPIKYRYDSIESQTRLLGDTLYMLQDYDTALSMYRLIKDDYKNDKQWIYYGAIQEIMALCMFMIDPYNTNRVQRDIFTSIENALLAYSRATDDIFTQLSSSQQQQIPLIGGRATMVPISTMLATRLCLILISSLSTVCIGRHIEVADLLASSSSNETALGAAVLLEQSAVQYYKANMIRKYAFHILMSGHMFRTAQQDHHAFRCFTSALYVYHHPLSRWEELYNHVLSALASQLYQMGRMSLSLQLYAILLGNSAGHPNHPQQQQRVSIKSQQKFIQNILDICNNHRKKALSGADRMAVIGGNGNATSTHSNCNERLDRIVQVIRSTKSASRILEIPNMNLPYIDDSTIVVIAEEAAHYRQESVPSFGTAQIGTSDIWEDLIITTNAELKAVAATTSTSNSTIRMTKSLMKIEDPTLRRVIAYIEEEKTNRERNRKMKTTTSSSSATNSNIDSIPVRAVKEPIAIEFVIRNPLGITIDICDLQLVARMTSNTSNSSKNRVICTNEDAVFIRPLVTYNEPMKWTFQSSNTIFQVADFCRISNTTNATDEYDGSRLETTPEAWKSAEDVEPLFVVTKMNLNLPPETKQVVTASICPLQLGNLEILGVRCKLLDTVWVYHPFYIKGPLLQNTRSNRANRVRGESVVLKSKVERGMPCFSVELRRTDTEQPSTASINDGPALQDQIGDWILRIVNVGTAAGCNLTLKTNLPWINVMTDETNAIDIAGDRESMAISCAIGPTGTLMQIPLAGTGVGQVGQLQPGETVDVPIRIKTSGFGKTDFYMLFRYELDDESSNMSTKPRCRWLKKMFSVPVYPSLGMTASTATTFDDSRDHMLSLELTNYRTDRPDRLDLSLRTLTVASRHYNVEPIIPLTSSISLEWQERAMIHFRLKEKAVDGGLTFLLSECALSESATIDSPPSLSKLNFLALERAHDAFEETMRLYHMALARAVAQGDDESQPLSIAAIRRANTVESGSFGGSVEKSMGDKYDSHPTSIERLSPSDGTPDTIHILCSWMAHNNTICGENHIRGLLVRPLTSTSLNECPVAVTCNYPSIVTNDFTTGPAIVPMKIELRNRLIEKSIQLEIVMDQSDTYDITGPEQYRTTLSGSHVITIPYVASIPKMGVFNLQNIRVKLLKSTGSMNNNHSGNSSNIDESLDITSYTFPFQWMVQVQQSI